MASGRGRRAETSDGQGRGVTSEYAIQLALPAHVPSLPGIERSAASLFDGILSAALLDATTPFSMLEEAQQAGRLWVAVDADGVRVHIAELDVSSDHQRRGVGTSLLRALATWAADNGFAEITLTTYRDIPWNAPAYLGMGFDFVPPSELDEHLRSHMDQEEASGFGVAPRVAMRRQLTVV
jgi:GNAT superfamily N-acetyltransferase